MTKPRYGEIYLVNFDPSVGHEYQKCRPAVVIQSDFQLAKSNLVTIMPLTSQVAKCYRDDIVVKPTAQNCLFAESVIKVYSITSFDNKRIIKHIGTMEETVLQKIRDYLKWHFRIG